MGDVAATPKMAEAGIQGEHGFLFGTSGDGGEQEVGEYMCVFVCWGMEAGSRKQEEGGRKDMGKKKSFPFPPHSHMASILFSSIFCSC